MKRNLPVVFCSWGWKMKVERFSSYFSVLLLLVSVSAWCWSWMTKTMVQMCWLDKASYFFSVFPQLLILLLLLLHFHVSTVHMNSGDMEVQKNKKLRASGYWKKKKKLRASGYCVVTQFAKKVAWSCFFSPCVANTVNNGAHKQ